ncbi:MAG TPA: glycoside hydrolase family 13 protein [Bacteroidota bacterium]|nr:glycoside hydrolase family 13 protein [Bacteroidota bacterium]
MREHRGWVFILGCVFFSSCFSQVPSADVSAVPGWARSAIWYQIFPERFRNGDTLNDPVLADLRGSWPHAEPAGWRRSSWTSDWFSLQPWERADSQGFYFNCQLRRYGGDIAGIIDRLDYLADLGINAIYLTPIFQSPSLHKYDAASYHHVDKNFGPDPAGDARLIAAEQPDDPATWKWTSADTLFLRLVREAHRRHIRIIIDGVFNHVGMTFWAFRDVREHQQNSHYRDWFTIRQWDDPATPDDEFRYQSWFGVPELPELRKTSDGMAPGPSAYIHAVVRRWMDPHNTGNPADGVDGWRLDAADRVPLGFWRQFRSWVKTINPDAYITGEIYWEDWQKDKMFNAAPWLKGDAFDAVMNYRWARELYTYFLNRKETISATEFAARLEALLRDYPAANDAVLMNLLDSHDTDRLLSHILNHDLPYDHRVGPPDNPDYDVAKPGKDQIRDMKMLILFQMAYLGAPMIYYGDEVGMWGGDDPDCRKPMLWSDYRYDDEQTHPFGKPRVRDRNTPDEELHAFYRQAIRLRKDHSALVSGSIAPYVVDDAKNIYSFIRSTAREKVIALFNRSDGIQQIDVPLPHDAGGRGCRDLITGAEVPVSGGNISCTVPARSALLLGMEIQ